jgi:Arf-GAP/coiled-coil/ANK repeat/PH domain-containing protein
MVNIYQHCISLVGINNNLHVCLSVGHTAQVCLLLKHRANQHLPDSEGVEPLTIAIQEANADIVTL